jgi:2-oxo-4-hydroxy-4-carboxy--5-ureidoimidazoline (OHCU) decarboxylase
MLAIGGVIAAAGTVAGIINKQAHAYEDLNTAIHKARKEADSLLGSYSGGNSAKKLDAETTQQLIKLYPQLAREITAYSSTVDDATRAVKRLTEAEVIRLADRQVEKLTKQKEAVRATAAAYGSCSVEARKMIELYEGAGDILSARMEEAKIEDYEQDWTDALKTAEETRREINAELAKIGKTLGDDDKTYIDLPAVPTVDSVSPPAAGESAAAKKRWQEWYSEITKVDLKSITMREQGEALGNLFIDGLTGTMTANQTIADVLGNEFDVAGALRSQRDEIERALKELLAISPSAIDDPFEFKDKFIDPLAERFKELDREIKNLEAGKTIEELQKKIDDFGKSEWQLAEETALANGYLPEQAAEIARLTQAWSLLSEEAQHEVRTLEDAIRKGLLKAFPDLEKQAAASLASITTNLMDLTFDGLLDGLSAVGAAFAKGEDAAGSFKAAMGEMSQAILDMLPGMFLQAGLQLIAQGQWALGLGFIAAAGSSALIGGITKGLVEKERETVSASAQGTVFDHALSAYARGGAFTNQLVTSPTYFRHGGGLGLMGEAGPEAVMPLKRLGNGNLGVEASGVGSTPVVINIYNNSGEPVTQEEHTGEDGSRHIDVMIGRLIDSHLASGKADRVLGARYNVRPQGV